MLSQIVVIFLYVFEIPVTKNLSKCLIIIAKTLYDCGNLSLNNGFANIVSNSTTPISKAILICNEGFVLFGDYIRYCDNDGGKWSGKESTCCKWSEWYSYLYSAFIILCVPFWYNAIINKIIQLLKALLKEVLLYFRSGHR